MAVWAKDKLQVSEEGYIVTRQSIAEQTELFKKSNEENRMNILSFRKVYALFVLAVFVLSMSLPVSVGAQTLAVDPSAMKILKRMTDHLGSLKKFSVHTQVTIEDWLDTGHRIDFDVSSSVIIERPNKLLAERRGESTDQAFYYDGKTLTLYSPGDKVYATDPAPKTIEGVLDYARDSLGLIVPIADLVYGNAFELLTEDVNFAVTLDKTVIGGVTCDHLLFSRPGVDFQVWVADGTKALPCKYVVTDTANPGRVSITTVLSDWGYASGKDGSVFTFVPPKGAKPITFVRQDTLGTFIK